MRRLPSLSSLAAIALAGASAYLVQQLGSERERARQAEARVAELETRLKSVQRESLGPREVAPQLPSTIDALSAAASVPVKSAPASEGAAAGATPARAGNRPESRQDRMYRSASTRALLRADRLAQLRAQNPRLARALGMTDAEAAELLEFLADQEMRRADAFNKSRRNREFNGGEIVAQQKRELAERLGEDRARKYEAYRNGAPDRQQVRSFRSRLDDSAMLSDAQAQALETALQDERERYASELKAELGDRTTFAMKSQFGRALMTSNPSSDEDAQERQLLEQMETYHRRARERAATLLSPEQLEAFEEFQAAQLASERVMLRRMRDTDPAK